jgi:site-specific DNA-methyltransferase (cytosine-N4-specific)
MENLQVLTGDCDVVLDTLSPKSVQTCITSPPYWKLRDYGCGDLGHEATPEEYTERLVKIFNKLWRVLRDDGTFWLVIGDSFCDGGGFSPNAPSNVAGSMQSTNMGVIDNVPTKSRPIPPGYKAKDLAGIPWMVAMALRKEGWYLRSDIIWEKLNGMPEPVKDRPNRIHEYIFLFSKRKKYYYDHKAVMEDAVNGEKRNCRSVWHLPKGGARGGSKVGKKQHFAVFPPQLVERCLLSSTREGDVVLDPFGGSGTTGKVAMAHNRKFIGIEINPTYSELMLEKLSQTPTL